MAKCVSCGKSGIFVKVNEDGLCTQCAKDKKLILDLDSTTNLLFDFVKKDSKSSLKKVQASIAAEDRINKRQLQNFEKLFNQFQRARDLEKAQKIEEALEIYLSLIPHRPEGTDYYTRPCIILEKQQRYQEAIDICDIAIHEIEEKHFRADAQEFWHRRDRLLKKLKK